MVIFWFELSPKRIPSHVPWRCCISAAIGWLTESLALPVLCSPALAMKEAMMLTMVRIFRNCFMVFKRQTAVCLSSKNREEIASCPFMQGEELSRVRRDLPNKPTTFRSIMDRLPLEVLLLAQGP
jgi:hypothetical protein